MTNISKLLNSSQKSRPDIAFFVDWIENEYQIKIMQGLVDAARQHEVNLYCLEGSYITEENWEIDRNLIYKLVNEQNVDGLIILTAAIGHYTSIEKMARFCRQYHPLPIVSIATEVEGCTSILIDNATGLRDAINHLIQVHQYQKLAFITGPKNNPDAIFRLETFKQTLAEYNTPFDANLVVEGNFSRHSGAEAVQTLLDKRKVTFDVIIASNDEMALGAIRELRNRKIKVPEEIAVIGFDDLETGVCSTPPLTTVKSSIYEQGYRAMELLLDLIAHRPVTQKIYIPSHFVLRESCGCLPQTALHCIVNPLNDATQEEVETVFLKSLDRLVVTIVTKTQPIFVDDYPEIDLNQVVGALLDALQRHLQGEKRDLFIRTFQNVLLEHQKPYDDLSAWQNFLSQLRQEIIPYTAISYHLQVENLFHQIRLIINEKAINREKINYHNALSQHNTLNHISEVLLSVMSTSQVLTVLSEMMPLLGIHTCYVSIYNIHSQKHVVTMAYNRKGKIELNKMNIRSNITLAPAEILSDGEPHVFLMMSIYSTEKHFSTIAVEIDQPITNIYDALRRIITSSLFGVKLNEKLRRQKKHLVSQQEHLRSLVDLRNAMEGFVQTILSTIEVRDPYTAGHQSQVSDLACAIATQMNISSEIIEGLRMAGIIHDLGKMAVPFEILNKPGRLKPTEFALIKEHPGIAYEILKKINFPWPIAQIVAQHHERLDGSGYPMGLHSHEILIEAKILAVADVIEAMASHRPYRPALGIEKALKEIATNRGILYDETVVDTCLDLFNVKGYKLS